MAATDQSPFTGRTKRLLCSPAPAAPIRRRSYLLAALTMLPLCWLLAFSPGPDRTAWLTTSSTAPVSAEYYIVGTVTDGATGEPLIGATVTIQGTKLATITDFDGEYRLQVPAGTHTIDYGYVGYRVGSSEVTITKNKRLDVSMYKNQAAEVRTGQTPVIVDRAATTTAGDQPHEQILVLLDGKKIDRDSVDRIDPQTIEAINVLKDVEKIRALGHGAGYTGAVLIKSYK